MRRNAPVQFEKGATEKVRQEPRWCPTSFGGGQLEKGQPWHLASCLPYYFSYTADQP